jgi:hypothetical protein
MAKQTINIGASPNDGTGTPLRTAFDYTNQNFTELYTALGGGVALPGATTQVIFNDGGTNLAGDAGLVYNKTTDALTVAGLVTAGSATITGDLTVDTNVLKVDTTNHRVGIGTASPGVRVDIVSDSNTSLAAVLRVNSNNVAVNTSLAYDGLIGSSTLTIQSGTSAPLIFNTNNVNERYRIASDGVATWSNVGGVAGTAMTLNSTGLGIGVVPSTHDAGKGLEVGALGNGLWCNNSTFNQLLQNATYNGGWKYAAAASTAASRLEMGGSFGFYIAPAGTAPNAITFGDAKMTLDASGNLLVGKTSSANTVAGVKLFTDSVDGGREYFTRQAGAASQTHVVFFESGGGVVGSISTTNVATAYNIASDYRLKQSVQPLTGGLARVNSLKPSTYKWNLDGSAGEGFIAHELAEVVPFAVSGQKDAVNEDGSIKIQGVDLSKIVPILVAAIQELTARVQTLEAR